MRAIIAAAAIWVFLSPFVCNCAEEKPADTDVKGVLVLLNNGDHITAKQVTLAEGRFTFKLPYVEALEMDRDFVTGLAYVSGRMRDIISEPVEKDTIHTTKGEVLSGEIRSIREDGISLSPSFATGKISLIPLDRVSHCILARPKEGGSETPADESGIVKVIFLNDDLLTGRITAYLDGKFTFQPLCGNAFSFAIGQYQTIHNAKTSKQYIEGGLAAALMNMLKSTGDLRSYGSSIFLTLVRGFVKAKDIDGAVYIFENLADFTVEPYVYRQLAEEFFRNEMYEQAVRAYKVVLDSNQRYYYDYDKLIQAYLKTGKKTEAAAAYEKFLENKDLLVRYGKDPCDIHLKAAELYAELKDFVKASEHLQKVIVDPNSKEHKRKEARERLISIYKERGQLDQLVSYYRKQLEDHEKAIGEGMVLLISKYVEQGKLTKARVEFERLKGIGMEDYIAKAEKVISGIDNPE